MTTTPHPPRRGGGDKRSSWLTFHRRLFLVRQLVRGPCDATTLIAAARAAFDAEIYPPNARTALRHDIAALRDAFACVITRSADGRYAMTDYGQLALLDLPDRDLEALSFLAGTFDESPLPNAGHVSALLDRIEALLPPERRLQLARAGRPLRLDTPQSSSNPDAALVERLRGALGQRFISFLYRSSYAQDGAVVAHRVAPYELMFRDGHTYLDAFCHACPLRDVEGHYVLYRADRIVADSLELHPTQLNLGPPPRRRYPLRYRLAPQVARQRDIALWFPESSVQFLEDGAAEVTAEITDLWQARQILLRYREHCRVFAPPELVALLRESVQRMAAQYAEDA
ncbi:MAG: WYL domain-containing protein [Chloroflexales bacterium]